MSLSLLVTYRSLSLDLRTTRYCYLFSRVDTTCQWDSGRTSLYKSCYHSECFGAPMVPPPPPQQPLIPLTVIGWIYDKHCEAAVLTECQPREICGRKRMLWGFLPCMHVLSLHIYMYVERDAIVHRILCTVIFDTCTLHQFLH